MMAIYVWERIGRCLSGGKCEEKNVYDGKREYWNFWNSKINSEIGILKKLVKDGKFKINE